MGTRHPAWLCEVDIIIPILQMKNLRLREVQKQSRDLNLEILSTLSPTKHVIGLVQRFKFILLELNYKTVEVQF